MPELPNHLYLGRGSFAGPIIGNYATLSIGPFQIATGDNGLVRASIYVPFDFRVESIGWSQRGNGTANVDLMVSHNTTVSTSGDTDLIDGVVQLDGATVGYVQKGAGSSTQRLVEAARNISRGRIILVTPTVDGTGVGTDVCVTVTGFITGHPVLDPVDD